VEEKPAKFRVALIWARLLESKDSAPRTQGMAARLCLSVTGITVLGDGLGKVKEVPTVVIRRLQCAGLNRHEAEDESSLRERSSDPLGLESCAGYREVHSEA
jgi:hypothetical protein